MSSIRTVLLLGKPGAGKGTEAKELVDSRAWRHIASGDYFRSLAAREDDLGVRVRTTYDTGALLPSWFTTRLLVEQMIELHPASGAVFDGFARSAEQAHEIHNVFSWFDRHYLAVNLEVRDEIIIDRIRRRNGQMKRVDSDSPEKITRRLAQYRQVSEPALSFFEERDVLRRIDGEQSIEEVHAAVTALL